MASQSTSAQLFSKEKIKNNENFDKQRISWGFYLGLNNYDYQFNYEQDAPDILVETNMGFSVGLISNLRINDFLDSPIDYELIFHLKVDKISDLFFDLTYQVAV